MFSFFLGKQVRGFLLITTFLLASCSSLHQTSAVDKLKPCKAGEGPSEAFCGTYSVWEDRQAKTGRKITLKVTILPALKQKYAPDPLFFLAGGPGQGAAELAEQIREPFRRLETDRDIVLIDQRGTGKSNPLTCQSEDKKEGQGEKQENEEDDSASVVKELHTCLDSLQKKADLTKYTTPVAMDDLDEVRAFLGYSKINVFGASYGTRAAIVYARRHADHTRTVILDGVAPPDMQLPLFMARDSQRALDLLMRDCEKDTACNQRFPHLRERFQTLLVRLDAHPQHIRYVHPRTGMEKDLDLKRLTITGLLFSSLYSPMTTAMVPLLIEQAEKGNYTGFLALGSAFDPLASSIAQGMHFSVVCSEDAPHISPEAIARETAGTFLGAEMVTLRLKPCDFWPRGQLDPAYFANAPSSLPTLILSGELDPVTPPSWGAHVASQWPHARHIVVPASGHGAWTSGCVMKLMAQFLNEGSAAKLDSSCVNHNQRPPFFLGPSGPDPLGGNPK